MSHGIAELRRLTVESRDLAAPLKYFYEHLVSLDEFMQCGKSAAHPMLEEILRKALPRADSGFDFAGVTMMFQVGQQGLWHGAAHSTRGGIAVFFYFDELGIGIAQIVTALDARDQQYLRFTAVPVDSAGPTGLTRGGKA